MRRIAQLSLALAVAVAVSATDSSAQDQYQKWGKVKNPEAQALMEQGDELFGNLDYVRARAKYESAVELIRTDGDFPAAPLYRMAASYYYEGKPMTAAGHFDALAREAALYGDLVTEVWALADAAWINGRAGDKLDMDAHVEKLQRLLKSPYLPAETKREIQANRLGEVTTLEQNDL
jgi:tetratricopeptide (TPR) repeat protein